MEAASSGAQVGEPRRGGRVEQAGAERPSLHSQALSTKKHSMMCAGGPYPPANPPWKPKRLTRQISVTNYGFSLAALG